ncbi:MAG: hypothetical protein RR128_10200 [Clostridium sp.]
MINHKITLSERCMGKYAVFGHVGVGHVHSHSSYVQDDSVGFAVASMMMREALGCDTRIKEIRAEVESGKIIVTTNGGGIGESYSSRGITPWEKKLLENAVGHDGIYTQNIAIKVFGRMYGQGVTTAPVAFQGAIALAVLNTFEKSSDKVISTRDKYQGLIDKMTAMVVEINGIPVSVMAVINGNEGGIGPNEDNEGNTAAGPKGNLIRQFKMDEVPTIIVESKAYILKLCKDLEETTFLIRAEKSIDNSELGKKLSEATMGLKLPFCFKDNLMPIEENHLKKSTMEFADRIIALGENLRKSESSKEKVEILFNLSKLVSEDAGGVTFMSNDIHNMVRSAGIIPGKSAILSMIVPREYINYYSIPILESEEAERLMNIIARTVTETSKSH